MLTYDYMYVGYLQWLITLLFTSTLIWAFPTDICIHSVHLELTVNKKRKTRKKWAPFAMYTLWVKGSLLSNIESMIIQWFMLSSAHSPPFSTGGWGRDCNGELTIVHNWGRAENKRGPKCSARALKPVSPPCNWVSRLYKQRTQQLFLTWCTIVLSMKQLL